MVLRLLRMTVSFRGESEHLDSFLNCVQFRSRFMARLFQELQLSSSDIEWPNCGLQLETDRSWLARLFTVSSFTQTAIPTFYVLWLLNKNPFQSRPCDQECRHLTLQNADTTTRIYSQPYWVESERKLGLFPHRNISALNPSCRPFTIHYPVRAPGRGLLKNRGFFRW
jgi:hypothetical protein